MHYAVYRNILTMYKGSQNTKYKFKDFLETKEEGFIIL